MNTTWLLWLGLSVATGSPLTALVAVLALAWLADRFTLRALPSPARAWARVHRRRRLRALLAVNPHDRRARLELADLLLATRPAEAADLVRANVEAGDDDVHTAYLLGAALARSGASDAAERVFAHARGIEPGFRVGELDLELGRMRLRRGDAAGAREALERLIAQHRPASVEGRFLLAGALDRLGDRAGAAKARDDAWREYAALPRFIRRQQRSWAWRAKPLRAVTALAGVAALAVLAAEVLAAFLRA